MASQIKFTLVKSTGKSSSCLTLVWDKLKQAMLSSVDLKNHLLTKDEDRDFNWDERFFKLFSECDLEILSPDPQIGPDHWPYLMTETVTDSDLGPLGATTKDLKLQKKQADSSQKVLRWLSEKGIGLVVNPQRQPYPDFVFSYGMIWYFRETGFFMNPPNKNLDRSTEIPAHSKLHTGSPTAQYLPKYVREILKNFFRDQGVLSPKILMISTDQVNYDLAFSIESLGNPPASEHKQIAEALAWFLPTHYSIAVVSEDGLPKFENL